VKKIKKNSLLTGEKKGRSKRPHLGRGIQLKGKKEKKRDWTGITLRLKSHIFFCSGEESSKQNQEGRGEPNRGTNGNLSGGG